MKAGPGKLPPGEPIKINEFWLMLPFFIVSLDALVSYSIASYFAFSRVGLFAVLALVGVVAKFGFKVLRIRDLWLVFLGIFCFSLAVGIVSASDIAASSRAFEILGIIIYFFCGYICFRWINNPNAVQLMFLLIGALYVGVCILALLKIVPDLFPLNERLWSQNGNLRTRPEIMTDQNFQVFYLLPVALGFVMPLTLIRGVVFGLLIMGAAYILAQIQTRSGSIILFSVLVLGLVAAIRNGRLGRKKIILIPALTIVVMLAALPFILEHASLLIYRFVDMGYGTAIGRLQSALYLFEKISDPGWWIPQGNTEFMKRHGVLPHSNFTAFFLEGGLLGLMAAIMLIAFPAIWLAIRVMNGNLDPIAAMVGCAGIGILILQLSLNVPTHSQVWLWAGAVIGIVERLRAEDSRKYRAARINLRPA